MFRAMLFCILDCGFQPVCALGNADSSEVRVSKILDLIHGCRLSIHDLSRVDSRMNMPFELGVFVGCKEYGSKRQREKRALVLASRQWEYQRYISDIAGQDISAHDDDPEKLIATIRNWLRVHIRDRRLPGSSKIVQRYQSFLADLPANCDGLQLTTDELNSFADFTFVVATWLESNPP